MTDPQPENGALAQALAALKQDLEALTRRVEALEATRGAGDAALQRDLRALRAKVGSLERQISRHYEHFSRELRKIWHHPAIRRLVRFNPFGLKLLGLFGLFGGAGPRTESDARPGSTSPKQPAGLIGKSPADVSALREDEETYLRGFCSLAHVRRPGPDEMAGEGLRLVVDAARLFSAELTGVGHYCEQLARALLRRTRHEVVAYSGKPLPQWMLDYAGPPAFLHMPPARARNRFEELESAPTLAEIAGRYDAYLHTSASYFPLLKAERMLSFVYDIAPLLCPETVPDHVVRSCEAYNRHLAAASASVVAISSYTKKTFVDFTGMDPDRVTVIPVGLDDLFRRPIAESDRVRVRRKYSLDFPYVLCVGTLQPRKNLSRLVDAYMQLCAGGVDVPRLVLMGSARWPDTDALADQIAALERDGHLVYTGYVERADMPALYEQCELFVYPSYFEGYGMPVAEAMACGAPVVCAGTTSLPEVAGDGAVYCDPHDAGAIAEAIRSTLADPECLANLRTKALEQAETFLSWDDVASRVLSCCKTLGD